METIYAAIAIFGMAAIVGLYLLSLVLRSKSTPKGVVVTHGLLAVTAVILLIVYSVGNTPGPWTALVVFAIAATGGIALAYKDITGQAVPKWLGVVHGATAVVGFILLLVFAFA